MFIAVLFTIVKIWRQIETSSGNERIKKTWNIYAMEYSLAIRNKILPFAATWIDQKGSMLSEVNQTEKDKYCMISLYIESKKIKQTS